LCNLFYTSIFAALCRIFSNKQADVAQLARAADL
jgi:hypothetical protein